MTKVRNINAKIQSISVFIPGTVSMFEYAPSFVTFFEKHSYVRGYSIMWEDDGKIYKSERFYDDDTYQNLKSFMVKNKDEKLNIKVEETNNKNVFKLVDVYFPENFNLKQQTKVLYFTPLGLRTKQCTFETYILSASKNNLYNYNIHKVLDESYQGTSSHSVSTTLGNDRISTKFSDLTDREVNKLKNSIRSSKQLKGTFIVTKNKSTLVNII